jgi:hypothetical protein
MNDVTPFLPNFNKNLPETHRYQTDIGSVSGKNVMEKYSSSNSAIVQNQNCSLGSIYKYICENITSKLNPWYRRWKDTAGV